MRDSRRKGCVRTPWEDGRNYRSDCGARSGLEKHTQWDTGSGMVNTWHGKKTSNLTVGRQTVGEETNDGSSREIAVAPDISHMFSFSGTVPLPSRLHSFSSQPSHNAHLNNTWLHRLSAAFTIRVWQISWFHLPMDLATRKIGIHSTPKPRWQRGSHDKDPGPLKLTQYSTWKPRLLIMGMKAVPAWTTLRMHWLKSSYVFLQCYKFHC